MRACIIADQFHILLKNLVQIIEIAGHAAEKLHRIADDSDTSRVALQFASELSTNFENLGKSFEDLNYLRDNAHTYFEQQKIHYMKNVVKQLEKHQNDLACGKDINNDRKTIT